MSVNSISRVSQGLAYYEAQANNMKNDKSTAQNAQSSSLQNQSESVKVGDAFKLDISDAAKQTQQKPAQTTDLSVEDEGDKETKKLSDDQIRALEEDAAAQQQFFFNVMIKALTESNDKLQGWLDEGVGILNFDGTQIDASRFAMPEVATNPEDAAKAIAPGGEWSVDAVATRVFDLASAIAGNDPEKLSQMRAAVEEGFKQAGTAWKDITGKDDMPSITKDTYNEIMSRFDKRANELNGTTVLE